VVRLGKFNILA